VPVFEINQLITYLDILTHRHTVAPDIALVRIETTLNWLQCQPLYRHLSFTQ